MSSTLSAMWYLEYIKIHDGLIPTVTHTHIGVHTHSACAGFDFSSDDDDDEADETAAARLIELES